MYRRLVILAIICLSTWGTQAQKNMVIPDIKDKVIVKNQGSEIFKSDCDGTISPLHIEDDWNVVLKNFSPFHHASSVPKEVFRSLKVDANAKREEKQSSSIIQNRLITEPPFLGRNFRGNLRGTGVPMDNSMAISRNGFVVSAINSNVIFTGPDGKVTLTKGFPDFFKLLGLGTRMYDPRVIYDVESNKFIFMVLHGSEPANTFLCLAFSKTEDPNGDWNYYKIAGNPSGDNRWFDYPNIAISHNDFYIAGLMRDLPGDWQYSVLYQIDKNDGYSGKPLSWKYYNELKDADGAPSFNLVPTPSGWDYLINPGMYFVSNAPNGGDTYNLYFTTGSLQDNPSIISMQTKGLLTELAPDGRQKNTTNVLNTFDSRIWSALYLNGIIHMGSHVNTPNGDVGLFYGRMSVQDMALQTDVLTTAGRDYGFPSFAAFGVAETDDDILVNYLVSGPDIFAGQEQRVCKGTSSFEWSEPVRLKDGVGIVNALQDDLERWGDYTTSCRRFFDGRTEAWVTGCFGESGSYGTWLGQFFRPEDEAQIPMAEFTADTTTTVKGKTIQFTDLTDKNARDWQWIFEGGSIDSSNEKAPKVQYNENGAYDVTLIVTNDLGTDTITKPDFIHIQDAEVAPVANFSYDRDTIFKDDSVLFSDMSSANTVTYKWTFINGSPSSSTEQNPLIKYSRVGSHVVALTVANIAGSNSKIVQKAITVLNRSAPKATISSDVQSIDVNGAIRFIDKSTGGPTSRKWYFQGGTPSESSEANPFVTYANAGSYSVTLVVENEFGKDSVTMIDYVTVGTSSVEDSEYISGFNLYPNPASNDMVTVDFYNNQTQKYKIDLIDANGRVVKNLYYDKVKGGDNRLTFNTYNLLGGSYFLTISDSQRILKTSKLVIVK